MEKVTLSVDWHASRRRQRGEPPGRQEPSASPGTEGQPDESRPQGSRYYGRVSFLVLSVEFRSTSAVSRRHRASIHLVRVVVSRDARALVEGNGEPRNTAAFAICRLDTSWTAPNARVVRERGAHQRLAAVEWTTARVGNGLDHYGVLCDTVTCEQRCVWPVKAL
jgi:hypothetical protein